MSQVSKPIGEHQTDRLMSGLAGLSAKTEAAERKILDTAVARRDAVNGRLEELRETAMIDDAAGQEYMDAIEERGRLDRVIALAQKRLDTTGRLA